jgi:lambda family phage portal protein
VKQTVPLLYRAAAAWDTFRGRRPAIPAVPAGAARHFNGADVNRLLADWLVTRMQRDDEIRWTIPMLRARARELENNDSTTKHYLRLLAQGVIGPDGARFQSLVRNNNDKLNEPFNEKIEDAFEEWKYQPTRDGKQDFVSFQSLLLRSIARDGEVFVRKVRAFDRNRFGFALEAIDPELIDERINRPSRDNGQREIRLGVEIDADGRPYAYHGYNKPTAMTSAVARDAVTYPANEIIHLYDPERVGQTRGVTWLSSVLINIKMLEGYAESELVAARIAAAKMGFYQKRADAGAGVLPSGQAAFTMEANPGTFGILPDGYELATWSPDHPSTAFDGFVKAAMRRISTGLGVSYNGLNNDLESVNYSSMRAGLLGERDLWRSLQRWWECAFLRPVYLEFLNSALLHSAIALDTRDYRKFTKHKFVHRGWAWVDPLKDTQAGTAAIAAGLASRTQLLAEQGEDLETVLEELSQEQKLADSMGVSINPAPAGGVDPGKAADGEDGTGDGSGDGAEGNGNGNRIAAHLNGARNGAGPRRIRR